MMIKKKTMVKMIFAAERTLGSTCWRSTSSAAGTTAYRPTTLSEKGHGDADGDDADDGYDHDDHGHNNDSLIVLRYTGFFLQQAWSAPM